MKEYRNYIFDLYGTLLDINADEHSDGLWKLLAGMYNAYGCEWKTRALAARYNEDDAQERMILGKRLGVEAPEIKLERVFARLYFESPGFHATGMKIAGYDAEKLRNMYSSAKTSEKALGIVTESEFILAISNLFRVRSRKYIRPFKNTVNTLKALRERGKHVYLLTNAQRIFTMPELEQSGLIPLFDAMYISSDCEIMKPQKEFMQVLLKKQKPDPGESVMVGNDPGSDVLVALRNDMDSILLNTWGWSRQKITRYVNDLIKKEELDKKHFPEIVLDGDIKHILEY